MPNDFTGLHVLVVDDNDDDRQLARIILEQEGAHADVVPSVEEGLAAFARRAPDVVVCDLRFGEGEPTGYTFIRNLERSADDPGARVPVLLVSGYTDETVRSELIAAGFDDVCAKPCEPSTLVHRIARLTGRADPAD
jgi:CheY-like chemotaxis protein